MYLCVKFDFWQKNIILPQHFVPICAFFSVFLERYGLLEHPKLPWAFLDAQSWARATFLPSLTLENLWIKSKEQILQIKFSEVEFLLTDSYQSKSEFVAKSFKNMPTKNCLIFMVIWLFRIFYAHFKKSTCLWDFK